MCDILTMPDGTEIQTVGELKKVMPQVTVIAFDSLLDNECLCWVDVPATAAAHGYDWERDDFGFTVWRREAP